MAKKLDGRSKKARAIKAAELERHGEVEPGDWLVGQTGEQYKPLTFSLDSASERQEGGSHYIDLPVQPWDAMQAWMTPEQFAGFLRGNVIKYMARNKNGVEDFKKAKHYLEKLLEVIV